jgi:hypothetical protein
MTGRGRATSGTVTFTGVTTGKGMPGPLKLNGSSTGTGTVTVTDPTGPPTATLLRITTQYLNHSFIKVTTNYVVHSMEPGRSLPRI